MCAGALSMLSYLLISFGFSGRCVGSVALGAPPMLALDVLGVLVCVCVCLLGTKGCLSLPIKWCLCVWLWFALSCVGASSIGLQ